MYLHLICDVHIEYSQGRAQDFLIGGANYCERGHVKLQWRSVGAAPGEGHSGPSRRLESGPPGPAPDVISHALLMNMAGVENFEK